MLKLLLKSHYICLLGMMIIPFFFLCRYILYIFKFLFCIRSAWKLSRCFLFTFSSSFKSFSTNVPLLYPLKTSENLWFSNVSRGYRSGTLVENGLIIHITLFAWIHMLELSRLSICIHTLMFVILGCVIARGGNVKRVEVVERS